MEYSFICKGCGVSFIDKKHKHRQYCSSSCSKLGSRNPNWVGDRVSYGALHTWAKNGLKIPECCQQCGMNKKLDLANLSGEYKRDLLDWEWLCRKCHMNKDGRLVAMLNRNSLKKVLLPDKQCITCGIIFSPKNKTQSSCSFGCRPPIRSNSRKVMDKTTLIIYNSIAEAARKLNLTQAKVISKRTKRFLLMSLIAFFTRCILYYH